MKVLFIGGTGFISTAVSRSAIDRGIELYLLNRGQRASARVSALIADVHKPEDSRGAFQDMEFDVVVDWIAYTPDDIERDLALFRDRVKQFVFISSASAYQTRRPTTSSQSRHLAQPALGLLPQQNRVRRASDAGVPRRRLSHYSVRPSLTYDTNFPIAIGGWGCYTLADRLKKGRPIIVHGDGSSLWVVTHAEDFGRGFSG